MRFQVSAALVLLVGTVTLAATTSHLSERAKLLGLGKTCAQSSQCESGFCEKAKCARPKGKGEPCTKNAGCATNKDGALRFCVRSKTSIYSDDGPVKLPVNACSPAPYQNVLKGGYCLHSSQCYIDLYCSGSKCTSQVGTAEECDKDSACKYGTCEDGKCTGREIGRHCGYDYQCGSGYCYHGYEDPLTQDTCQAPPSPP